MRVIKQITHPFPVETLQARKDFAEVWGKGVVERPWWIESTETGHTYYAIYGCIGWPEDVSAKDKQQPGYIAVVGVLRPTNAEVVGYDPTGAQFHILEEAQSGDIFTLFKHCERLRDKYSAYPECLQTWYGDHTRFVRAVSLWTMRGGGMIIPPDDFDAKNRFEIYLRSLRGVLQRDNLRLYVGAILKARLGQFEKDDPVVTAIGGLVHTLTLRQPWMDRVEKDNFMVFEMNG